MPWQFIIPLALALVVTYILTNSADEIAYLSASILLVSLVLSLIFAPWPIQLVLVILVLLSNKLFSTPQSPRVEFQEDNNEKNQNQTNVKLSYRGVNYAETTPPAVEVPESEITGKYRGQVWKDPLLKNTTGLQPTKGLKYRGASFTDIEPLSPVDKETPILKG